ncbi:MAG: diguanylate cyclase [Candidatus Methylomirabilis sp.]
MRFALRTKEAFLILFLTFLVVATTTFIHLVQLTRVIVQEVSGQAELIAKQIYAQSRRSFARARGGDPRKILKSDQELRNLLDASVGYSPYLLYALISDREGSTILHSEREKEGSGAPERPSLTQILSFDPVRRFHLLYKGGTIFETTLVLSLDGKTFGNIRLGIATSLLGRELRNSLKQSLTLAGVALPVVWLLAMALANRMLGQVRATSHVDELTGLYNRRGFLLLAKQQVKIADRTRKGMLLLFADLDGMKRINDTLGHHDGDLALIDTANTFKETFRDADIIARIGGDEFAIIALETSKDIAEILIARLQENFNARNAKGDRRYTLLISLGIARYDPESPCSIDELLAMADTSMYGQKQTKLRSSL